MFRRMWAAEPWLKLAYDRPTCFSRTRDKGGADHQDANTFFDLTANGLICDTNWYAHPSHISFVPSGTPRTDCTDCATPSLHSPTPRRYEGNFGLLGLPGRTTTFPTPAPALLGFDETIDDFCSSRRHDAGDWGDYMGHAENCRLASMNILSLYGTRLPYNICRC